MTRQAQPELIGRYRRGDGLNALVGMQLAIADRQDREHCSWCGRHLGMWLYGFPFPLCCFCIDKACGPVRLRCPVKKIGGQPNQRGPGRRVV